MKPTPVVIITGLSCTGKTTLTRQLSAQSGLPVFSKDALKELLFDTLGCKGVAWSNQVNKAAYAVLYHLFEMHLQVGRPCILESNFRPPLATPIFQRLMEQYGFRPIQLHLVADPEEILRRYARRINSGSRHPGHCDHLNLARFTEKVRTVGDPGPLEIGGELMKIDTTHFKDSDWKQVASMVSALV